MTGESHRALREQLGSYALGQLSGEESRAVRAHLQQCAQCRVDLEQIAPVVGLLGEAADRLDPDRLAEQVDAAHARGSSAASAEPAPLSPALLAEVRAAGYDKRAPRQRRSSRQRRLVLAAAAAVALLVVGGVGFVLGASARGTETAAIGESVGVRAVDQRVQASARLVAHTWGMEVKLTGTGFAAGQSYRVTVTDDRERTVGAGEFIGTGGEEMRCNLNSSVLRADASSFQVSDPSGQVLLVAEL